MTERQRQMMKEIKRKASAKNHKIMQNRLKNWEKKVEKVGSIFLMLQKNSGFYVEV